VEGVMGQIGYYVPKSIVMDGSQPRGFLWVILMLSATSRTG